MSELVEKLEKLESATGQFDDVFSAEAADLRGECKIINANAMKQHIAELTEEGRMLNIGIIGRVKAGKSSLLNSVFFNGEDVLPKAATPMTASLTVMTYGDTFSATVEYYTAQDIEGIRKGYDSFAGKQKRLLDDKINGLEERAKKHGEHIDRAEIEEKARRQVNTELKDDVTFASFDQFERMKKSGKLDRMMGRVEHTETIDASDIKSLLSKLNQYVGSDGDLMPFTKSAQIRLCLPVLQDIQVVDTPGINDPVISREVRTEEYLKKCDVVFIVSSAGQFVSSEDMELMDRLSSKEGVQLLYFVASQADNQLYGSVLEESKGDLNAAIKSISTDLSRHAADTLRTLKANHPEIAGQFDQLIGGGDKVIITSAICHAMKLRYQERAAWDEGMNHVWGLLSENYPDYFDQSSGEASLARLSNISRVNEQIEFARGKKDEIIAGKREKYLTEQEANVEDFKNRLIKAADEKIGQLQNTDMQKVQEEKAKIESICAKGSEAIDGSFEDSVADFKIELRDAITEKSRTLFDQTKNSVSGAEGSKTETRHWTTGILFWKKDHSENYEVQTVRAGAVKSTLTELLTDLEDSVIASVEKAKLGWKKKVQSKITHDLREAIEDDDKIPFDLLKTALRRKINSLEIPPFDMGEYSFEKSSEDEAAQKPRGFGFLSGSGGNRSGTLEGDDAENFMGEVQEYLGSLRNQYSKKTRDFLDALQKSVGAGKMSDQIFGELSSQISALEQEIGNKKLTLDRLGKCKAAFEAIK
jgi:hypothetical protein